MPRTLPFAASVGILVAGVALSHCGDDTSVGDGGGDASADARADASVSADANGNGSADASGDAASDASATDSSADGAANTDAGGPVVLCAAATIAAATDAGRTLLFCDDFDEVTDPTTGWGTVFVHQDAGLFLLDTTTFASPPQSARFAYFSDQFASFWMSQKVALPASGIYTFSFDWYFDPTPFEIEFMRAFQLGAKSNGLNLLADPGSPSAVRFGVVKKSGSGYDYSDSGALATDAWHHVVVHVENDMVHLTIDALDFGTFSFAQEAGAPPGSFEIEVSPDTMVDAAAVNAWFDNVEVTTP